MSLVSNGAGGAVIFGGLINDSIAESNGGAGVFLVSILTCAEA
ncbi:hypothetical protein ACFS07_19165 [Undibacterium arcticum]